MSIENKTEKPTILELFQKMHEEKSHSTESYSLTQPKNPTETIKEMTQERFSNDVHAGKTWFPAMVVHNLESKVREASIGDRTLVGGHALAYSATGNKAITVRCLVPENTLRHPTTYDDPILRSYPKFTCDLNTLKSIPPVGSILMVMWNNKNIRKGGIILGYALGGQKQQDDFTIFAAPDGCGDVVPNKMKTTHAVGESLPAENRATATEIKVDNVVTDEKEVEDVFGFAAPNSTWVVTGSAPPGSVVPPVAETKKNPETPAEVPNIVTPPEEPPPEKIVCNTSYTLGETTEGTNGQTEPAAVPPKSVSPPEDVADKDCNIYRIAEETKMPPRLVKAFTMIESGRLGARAMRFEAHIFLGVASLSNIVYPKRRKGRPDLRGKISYTPRGPRGTPSWFISRLHKESNRAAFRKAYKLDKKIAIQSTSFGVFQVMGHVLLRIYGNRGRDPDRALQAYNSDPQKVSDDLFIAWYSKKVDFKRAVEASVKTGKYDWQRLAKTYNGSTTPLSNKRSYAAKLKRAYESLEGVETFCSDGVPSNNPRPPKEPEQRPITLTSWVRGRNKGEIPAYEVIKDGPTKGARGKKGLLAKKLEEPINKMKEAYKKEVPGGPPLQINSVYRSYNAQLSERRAALLPEHRAEYARLGGRGNPDAEKWLATRSPQLKYFRINVAAPGYSNHNSGIAVDFNTNAGGGLPSTKKAPLPYDQDRFYDKRTKNPRYRGKPAHNIPGLPNSTVQPHKWLHDNAHRFGFIRTVKGERWHYVYVGSSATRRRYSRVKKTHGSNDGLAGHIPAKEAARRRRATQAARRGASVGGGPVMTEG